MKVFNVVGLSRGPRMMRRKENQVDLDQLTITVVLIANAHCAIVIMEIMKGMVNEWLNL